MRSWMNYAGAFLLILTGTSLYSWDPALATVWTPALAPQLIVAGLVWAGLALNNPLRERSYQRSPAGSVRTWPARGAGHRRHRASRRVAARSFTGVGLLRPHGAGGERGGVAMNAPAAVAGGSFLKDSVRIGTREARRNLYGARGSMWAVLTAVVLNLASSDLLLTDKELSSSGQGQVLYTVASLAIGMGLLVAGVFAADPVSGKKERTAPEGVLPDPTKRGALLFGKVLGVLAMWLLIFAISAPYILVAGFGASVPWVGLIYTFVLGTFCVAGFATLTVGLSALSRSGRGVMLVSMAALIAMAAPTLLGATLPQKSWFGNAYNALSPVAQARLSLQNVVVDKETLLLQLPHAGALAAFVVVAGVFTAFAARGFSPEGGRWYEGSEDFKPWDPLRTRSGTNEPARVPRGQK